TVEWRTNFFGDITNPGAAMNADPDGDGHLNWQEYLAGTHPLQADSKLQLRTPALTIENNQPVAILKWISAPAKTYKIQSAASIANPNWETVAENIAGDGHVLEIRHAANQKARFYRILVFSP
ncbi:MAG: hypothetical protein AB1813_09080, partial [Verrucomicrobiota bacterium]